MPPGDHVRFFYASGGSRERLTEFHPGLSVLGKKKSCTSASVCSKFMKVCKKNKKIDAQLSGRHQ